MILQVLFISNILTHIARSNATSNTSEHTDHAIALEADAMDVVTLVIINDGNLCTLQGDWDATASWKKVRFISMCCLKKYTVHKTLHTQYYHFSNDYLLQMS